MAVGILLITHEGIGHALVGNAFGYRTIIVMPDNQSQEKMDTLRALGAELVLVPPTKYSDPNHFVHTSRRLAEETGGNVTLREYPGGWHALLADFGWEERMNDLVLWISE